MNEVAGVVSNEEGSELYCRLLLQRRQSGVRWGAHAPWTRRFRNVNFRGLKVSLALSEPTAEVCPCILVQASSVMGFSNNIIVAFIGDTRAGLLMSDRYSPWTSSPILVILLYSGI